jgi:RNA polymerase sigma factor (sigma-70 family)
VGEHEWLARQFEEHRGHLRAVAHRMLGSAAEADDAVQEAWLRFSRSDTSAVENLRGWLTTVVARLCLTALQARRREEPVDETAREQAAAPEEGTDPEHEAIVADSVGLALLVVLETLPPAERLAFVLHDLFAVPFDEIAPIVDRSPAAARQLASRGRRRVQGRATVPASGADQARQREVVEAFLAASRGGDFEALLAVLDPDIVLRADAVAVRTGAPREVRGADAVARTFFGRARAVRPALVNGLVGAVWMVKGRPRMAFGFTIRGGRIVGISMAADPEHLEQLDFETLR